ncbi:hypothetical protein CEQ90_09110 [Lewinellaceae bacterium SD302]|nr:hypothetical protein CEQ90_09110 [Lewinellaceae bacterium SD302]
MEKIIKRILDNKLQDFSGTRLKGQLVLHDELVNEVLGLGLVELTKSPANGDTVEATTEASSAISPPDPRVMLSALKIDQLNYRSEVGQVTLELDVSIPDRD